MQSFRNLVNFIQFEYILYPLICCLLFGLNEREKDIETRGKIAMVYSIALEIELNNAYKHLLRKRKKSAKYFITLLSRYHMYDVPVLVHIA